MGKRRISRVAQSQTPNRRSVDMPSARTVLADPANGLHILDEYERMLWGELHQAQEYRQHTNSKGLRDEDNDNSDEVVHQ